MFDERQVKPLPKGSMQERVEAEHLGRGLVLKGKVGDFVGIQNRAGDEDDTFWVAQLVDSQQGEKMHPHSFKIRGAGWPAGRPAVLTLLSHPRAVLATGNRRVPGKASSV